MAAKYKDLGCHTIIGHPHFDTGLAVYRRRASVYLNKMALPNHFWGHLPLYWWICQSHFTNVVASLDWFRHDYHRLNRWSMIRYVKIHFANITFTCLTAFLDLRCFKNSRLFVRDVVAV